MILLVTFASQIKSIVVYFKLQLFYLCLRAWKNLHFLLFLGAGYPSVPVMC